MSLAPLLAAAPEIQLHAFAALAAFVLGGVQLAAPKGIGIVDVPLVVTLVRLLYSLCGNSGPHRPKMALHFSRSGKQ